MDVTSIDAAVHRVSIDRARIPITPITSAIAIRASQGLDGWGGLCSGYGLIKESPEVNSISIQCTQTEQVLTLRSGR